MHVAIQYTMHGEGDTLWVKATGFDESLQEVEEYGISVIRACLAAGHSRVLCDETDLEYTLSTIDTYRAAVSIAEAAPEIARVAIVPNPRYIADARFWEDVAVNRGLTVRVFRSIDDAAKWLGD